MMSTEQRKPKLSMRGIQSKTAVFRAQGRLSDSSISTRPSINWLESSSPQHVTMLHGRKPDNNTPKPKNKKWNHSKGNGVPSPYVPNSDPQQQQQQQQQQNKKGKGKNNGQNNKGKGKGKGQQGGKPKQNPRKPVDKIITHDIEEFNRFVARRMTEPIPEPVPTMPRLLSFEERKQNDINSRRASLPENNLREDFRQSVCKPGEVSGYIKAMNKLRRDAAQLHRELSERSCTMSYFTAMSSSSLGGFNRCSASSIGGINRNSRSRHAVEVPPPPPIRKATGELERTLSPKYHAERRSSVPTFIGISATKGPKGPADDSIGFKRHRMPEFLEIGICAFPCDPCEPEPTPPKPLLVDEPMSPLSVDEPMSPLSLKSQCSSNALVRALTNEFSHISMA